MKIIAVDVYKSPVALKKPFVISLGRFDHALNVVVLIRTDEGLIGSGECSPFMSINGESMDTCFQVAQYLGKALLGSDPLDIASCIPVMDGVIYGNASIKSAFDMALYDIASQKAGKPLYEFLGGVKSEKIFTDYTVSIGDPGVMAADALVIKNSGYPVIKVKLGADPVLDVERMRSIREAVGFDIPIRIDANQGWRADEVPAILEKLSAFRIQHCEEPINRRAFTLLPRLKERSPIPLMADESCCDHYDAARLAETGSCDLFNIKLGKSGGIHEALLIIDVAEKYGIGIQLGGFLESRLAFTAAAHLAMVSDCIRYFDFDTPLMFSGDPVGGGIVYGPGGRIDLPSGPGLGARFLPEHLNRCESVCIKG